MARFLRIALTVVGIGVLVLGLLVAAAWFLMPKDWIDREAKRQAERIPGATIRWNRLEPGLSWLALGVRIEGLYVRVPAEGGGEPELEARVRDIFVSFRLLPLLSRRVEIAAARVSGAGIAVTERAAAPDSAGAAATPPPGQAAGLALVLPRLDLDEIDIRTRDVLGGGIDLRHLSGRTEVEGTLEQPRAIRFAAKADSLFWKPSAKEASRALPSPLRVDVEARAGDKADRLMVQRGLVQLGPLESSLSGEIHLGSAAKGPELALVLTGKPQLIRSSDEAFRPLAAAYPASWFTTASWEIEIKGPASGPIQTGRVVLKPVSITSGVNTFTVASAVATWTTKPDRTFTSRVKAVDQGLDLVLSAAGSMAPGGAMSGNLGVHAAAIRLNGLAPNLPTWREGNLACRAVFTIEPPAAPSVGWTAQGEGLSGDIPGLTRPVSRMSFDIKGDEKAVSIRSFDATVGSTTASLTGTVLPGKPLGTATFRATLDRFVAEEWAPPPAATAKGAAKAPPPPPSVPPIPLQSFAGMVSIGELKSGKMTVRDVEVPVQYANGTLTAAPITGKIGTGSINGGVRLNDLVTQPTYALKLDVKRAPVEEFAAGILPFKLGLTGFTSGTVDLSGPGFPGVEVGDSLRGSMTGTIEQGRILETPTIIGLRNALGIGPSSDASGDLVFKTLTHSLRIDRGRLLLDKVKGEVGKDLFEMVGSMGFDQSLNLDLLLKIAPERIKSGTALAEFARYARDKDGRLPVSITVTGTALAPKFSLKAGKTLEIAGSKLQEQLIQSLAKSSKGDSARHDSTAADDPGKKARDLLKQLLGK